jgi:hypothetical protein
MYFSQVVIHQRQLHVLQISQVVIHQRHLHVLQPNGYPSAPSTCAFLSRGDFFHHHHLINYIDDCDVAQLYNVQNICNQAVQQMSDIGLPDVKKSTFLYHSGAR